MVLLKARVTTTVALLVFLLVSATTTTTTTTAMEIDDNNDVENQAPGLRGKRSKNAQHLMDAPPVEHRDLLLAQVPDCSRMDPTILCPLPSGELFCETMTDTVMEACFCKVDGGYDCFFW
uniref:Uncharacterized protein n=1 Tax=Cyclophora tenuis TaxID=216820 RepID=A0A7S1DCZ2_CYCTE|mmetsp:Transcript_9998/g.16744  ORF Transcript_9998/g.16744 Transcript_9998/m.16744 type:complete len:120 (+) Transcript_9998:170-529(+)